MSEQAATGQALGDANVTLVQATTAVVPVTITVSGSVVTVISLSGVVVTGVEWAQRPSALVEWAPVGTQMSARVRLLQQLTQEGSAGEVQAVAHLSDGTRYLVPQSELVVQSRSPKLLAVSPASPSAAWTVVVASGATQECAALVEVAWQTCNVLVGVGTAPVDLQLPTATSMQLSAAA